MESKRALPSTPPRARKTKKRAGPVVNVDLRGTTAADEVLEVGDGQQAALLDERKMHKSIFNQYQHAAEEQEATSRRERGERLARDKRDAEHRLLLLRQGAALLRRWLMVDALTHVRQSSMRRSVSDRLSASTGSSSWSRRSSKSSPRKRPRNASWIDSPSKAKQPVRSKTCSASNPGSAYTFTRSGGA